MSILRAVFEGYSSAKPKHRDWEYEYLLTTPVLHSSQYLNELYEHAKTKEQKECIIQHLNRHDTYGVENYRNIQDKFINERWK